MSFAEEMKRVEAAALAEDRALRTAWDLFIGACTVDDVCFCITDYLADFGFSGERIRSTYAIDVSVYLAEALKHAQQRQQCFTKALERLAEALSQYNHAVTRGRGETEGLNELRLALALALLAVE